MKDYVLIYFCAIIAIIAITRPVKSSSLEYENSQNLPANLYYSVPNIGRQGSAGNLDQLNSENNNLLRNANNKYHLNPGNNNLQPNNGLRERNYLNLYNSENYNLGRQGVDVYPAEPPNADQDLDVADLEPQAESRFGGGGGLGGGSVQV